MALARGVAAGLPPALAARAWRPVGGGESGGAVYRADDGEALFLKHGRGRVADDVADEAHRLRWLARRVACPTVRWFAAEHDAAWLVTTALPGRTGDDLLEADPERLDAVIAGSAGLLRELHALPAAECPFEAGAELRLAHARANAAAGLVDEDDFDDDHAGWSAAQMLAHTEALLPDGGARVVTHGDWSLGNILFDEAGAVTGCIDVGRLGVADPYQDIAVMWQNLGEFGAGAQAAWLAAMRIDAVDERRFAFHRCLDELF